MISIVVSPSESPVFDEEVISPRPELSVDVDFPEPLPSLPLEVLWSPPPEETSVFERPRSKEAPLQSAGFEAEEAQDLSYQTGRAFVDWDHSMSSTCSLVNLPLAFKESATLRIVATLERQTPYIFSTKANVDITNVTCEHFTVCITAVRENLQEKGLLSISWLALAKDEPWIETGLIPFDSNFGFLDGRCRVVSDNRVSKSKQTVVIPGQYANEGTHSNAKIQRGVLKWVEKVDEHRFSYCMQRVVRQMRGAKPSSILSTESYFIISAVHGDANLELGSLSIPPWRPGRNCGYVKLKNAKSVPFVFVGLEHPASLGNAYSSDAALTWVSNVTHEGFWLCVEEVRDFWEDRQAFRSEARAHWVAMYP